jgi:hypothetical protein
MRPDSTQPLRGGEWFCPHNCRGLKPHGYDTEPRARSTLQSAPLPQHTKQLGVVTRLATPRCEL